MLLDPLLLLLAGPAPLPASVPTPDPLAATPAPVQESKVESLALPYTYIGVNWVTTSLDGYSSDPDGLSIDAAYALNDTWFVYGSRSILEGEAGGSSVDRTAWHAGIGLHTSVTEQADFVLGAGWMDLHSDSSAPGPSDDQGLELRAGVRIALGLRAEAGAGVVYTDLDEAGNDAGVYLDTAFYVEKRFGLTAAFSSANDADTFTLGLRFVP